MDHIANHPRVHRKLFFNGWGRIVTQRKCELGYRGGSQASRCAVGSPQSQPRGGTEAHLQVSCLCDIRLPFFLLGPLIWQIQSLVHEQDEESSESHYQIGSSLDWRGSRVIMSKAGCVGILWHSCSWPTRSEFLAWQPRKVIFERTSCWGATVLERSPLNMNNVSNSHWQTLSVIPAN